MSSKFPFNSSFLAFKDLAPKYLFSPPPLPTMGLGNKPNYPLFLAYAFLPLSSSSAAPPHTVSSATLLSQILSSLQGRLGHRLAQEAFQISAKRN